MNTTTVETKAKNGIAGWVSELDRILRGETTCQLEIFRDSSKTADIRFPVGGISVVLGALGASYGLCMSVFAMVSGAEAGEFAQSCLQVMASMSKVPLLFVLTIVVTFPSLYVFNALMGSRLNIAAVFRLLLASLAVNLSVLASLGPVVAFFSLSSPNYSFIVLLNVLVFAIAGIIGLGFMIQTTNRLKQDSRMSLVADSGSESATTSSLELPSSNAIEIGDNDIVEKYSKDSQANSLLSPSKSECLPSAGLNRTPGTNRRNVDLVFSCWMAAFGLVGAQMGWILRPFIGAPSLEFQILRNRESNFFAAVWNTLLNVFS